MRMVCVRNTCTGWSEPTFALMKEAFYTPILDRAAQLAGLNARVVEAWKQPATYDTIRNYLERTVGKK